MLYIKNFMPLPQIQELEAKADLCQLPSTYSNR